MRWLALVLALVSAPVSAQPTELWTATWSNDVDMNRDTLGHRDHSPRWSTRRAFAVGDQIAIAGWSSGSDANGFYARYDFDGSLDHEQVFVGPVWIDYFTAVTFDPDGNAYVVGTTWGPTAELGCEYVGPEGVAIVLKYSPTGERLWCRGFEGTGTEHEVAWQVQWAMDRVYVGAETSETGFAQQLTVVNFDANSGMEQWRQSFGTTANDRFNDMAVDGTTGDVFVVGQGNTGTGIEWIVGRADSDGGLGFAQTFSGTGSGENVPTAVVPDGAGGAVIAGWMHNMTTSTDATLLRVDSAGVEQWRRDYNGSADNTDRLYALELYGDVLVAAGRAANAMGRNTDALVLRYGLDGEELCSGLFHHRQEEAFDVTADEAGNIYVAGHSFSDSVLGEDFLVVSFDDACEVRWDVRRDGGMTDADFAYAIHALGEDDVVVAGDVNANGGQSDVIVVRYVIACTDASDCDDSLPCTVDACEDMVCTHELAPMGTVCRASTGVCDPGEMCDGSSDVCPSDQLAAAGTECRAAVGECDVAETCDGSGADCPADGFAEAGTECRAASNVCDASESCDGLSAMCPSDVFNNGAVCGDDLCGNPLMCVDGMCPPSDCEVDSGGGGCGGCTTSNPASAWLGFALLALALRRRYSL